MGLNESDIRRILWTFVQAFLGALLVGVAGWAAIPSGWDAWKAAGVSAVKNLFLTDTSSLK